MTSFLTFAGFRTAGEIGISRRYDPPANTGAPVVSGTPLIGNILVCSPGTWSGTEPLTYSYTWVVNGVDWSTDAINSITVQPAWNGKKVKCRVTVSNPGGSASVDSNETDFVSSGLPSNITAPVITGEAKVGQTLVVSLGEWTNQPTFTVQWKASGVAISAATDTSYLLTSAEVGKTITATVTAVNSFGSASVTTAATTLVAAAGGGTFPDGTLPTGEVVAGYAIGDAGTGIYSGMTLTFGDDFNAPFVNWTARNLTGKYATSHWSVPRAVTNSRAIRVDPDFQGISSKSPVSLNLNPYDVAEGAVTMWARPIPTEAAPFMPTTGYGSGTQAPALYTGCMNTHPSFLFNGATDFIYEALVEFDPTVKNGYWPAIWNSGLNWPDYQEADMFEAFKSPAGATTTQLGLNYNGSQTDGASNSQRTINTVTPPTDRPVWIALAKRGTVITWYTDIASQGTLAGAGTFSDNRWTGRIRGPHNLKIDMGVGYSWTSSGSFSLAQWPGFVKIHWFRAWTPSAGGLNTYPRIFQFNTAPGGSWAATIPADNLMWNGPTPDTVYYTTFWDNEDNPGWPTRQSVPLPGQVVPGGMTVDLAGKAVTGSVPTGSGGATALAFLGVYNNGKPCARTLFVYNVAPAAQSTLFGNLAPARNAALNVAVNYADFHSGNLGPHTYTVSKTSGGSWITITGNGTTGVTLTGTTPNSADTSVLSITCTNKLGQTTTVSRTITVA